jgi:hypothetical protein
MIFLFQNYCFGNPKKRTGLFNKIIFVDTLCAGHFQIEREQHSPEERFYIADTVNFRAAYPQFPKFRPPVAVYIFCLENERFGKFFHPAPDVFYLFEIAGVGHFVEKQHFNMTQAVRVVGHV